MADQNIPLTHEDVPYGSTLSDYGRNPALISSMPGKKAEEDAFNQWIKNSNLKMTSDNLDYLYQQFFTEKNNESAWQRTMEADRTKYQRAVEDIRKAGLNPIQVLNGGISNAGSSTAGNITGGSIASSENSKRSAAATMTGGVSAAIAIVLAAILKVLF